VQYGKIEVKLGDETRTLTDPVVTVPNPLLDRGIPIPGFNDDYAGSAPDLGAFELGRPPVRFGRDAVERVWAPWEIY
jgi:hypothetical protein